MRTLALTIISAFVCVMVFAGRSHAGIQIDVSGAPDLTLEGIQETTKKLEDIFVNIGPAMTNALLMANLGGYPMGKSSLGAFPHFTAGISFNVGLANMKYFDSRYERPSGYFPAFGLNPVIFGGIGLSDKVDVLFKFFIYSSGFYRPPLDFSYATLTRLNLYSAGGKVRYRLADPVPILPGLFHFGGFVIGVGADVMGGNIDIDGRYQYSLGSINVDCGPPKDIPVYLDSQYSASTSWFIFSSGLQAVVYIDIFWIFSLYTGIGCSLNFGYFSVKGSGTARAFTTDTASYPPGTIGTITATMKYRYMPKVLLPVYIVGMEINLYIIRLGVESMVDLRNRSDINIQFGARYQF